MDSTDKGLILGLGIMLFLATISMSLIFLFSKPTEHMNKEKTCQDLGGKYVIIDKEWIGKSNYMSIYGCVK